MVPTKEEIILAMLDLLVDPLLPTEFSNATKNYVTISKEAMVAKQMQTVVILFNYYQRKQDPRLDSMDFPSFCKVAATLKPTLSIYMKATLREALPMESLSTTEKMIMEACEISKAIETSDMEDEDIIETWPVSKIAILLVDHKKKNCYLVHSSITLGIWSLVEKDVDAEEVMRKMKRKTVSKKTGRRRKSVEQVDHLQQIACAAAAEVSGCSSLEVLETHTVRSVSKPETTARFYIIQNTQQYGESCYIPISDVISSTQGPLVKKEGCICITTSVVEHFHVLPYIKIISTWFSRIHPQLVESNEMVLVEETGIELSTNAIAENQGIMLCEDEIPVSYEPNELYEENQDVESYLDEIDSSNASELVERCRWNGEDKNIKVYTRRNKSLTGDISWKIGDNLERMNEQNGGNDKSEEKIVSPLVQDQDLIPSGSVDPKGINRIYEIVASKATLLSQIAYKGLVRKKSMLHDQEEITLCEEKMKDILKGGDDGLAITLESIIECYGEEDSSKHQEANSLIIQ